jgi:hypothetical protein
MLASEKSTIVRADVDVNYHAQVVDLFIQIGSEVPDVVRALRSNGIDVTAIHSHMLAEEPRIIFLHFWANDDALKLARGLRAALDKTASARS